MRCNQLIAFLVLPVIATAAHITENFINPGNTWFYFGDSASGGISLSHRPRQSDSILVWTFELKRGEHYQWPYTGISRELTSRDQRSFTGEATLVAEICSNREGPLLFKLATFDPGRSTPDDPSSFRVLEFAVTVKKERQHYRIPLGNFRIPEWYKNENNIPPEDNEPFWDSLRLVQIIINDTRRINNVDTLLLYDLHLEEKDGKTAGWQFFLLALIPILTVPILLQRKIRKKSATVSIPLQPAINLHPKKVRSVPSDWERTLAFIEQHYTSQSLTIQQTADALGFSDSKLSRLISEKYPDGFRALVHELRIKEGKRLLRQSEMNIGEIAYELGYAVPSHFNREFKKRCGITPGVFRKDSNNPTAT